MEYRKIMYIVISIICVISVIVAIFIQINLEPVKNKNKENNTVKEKTQEILRKEFEEIFDNKINTNNYDLSKIKKTDDQKEIVYTAYQNQEIEENKYELDVNIPLINIQGDIAYQFNLRTQKLFVDKNNKIIESVKGYTIYSVEYTGFINDDILSVIIKSTLKEGKNPQRIIIETYNYNLKEDKEVSIYDVISKKEIKEKELQDKVNLEITKAIREENRIQLTGYETFTRDINSEIYQIKNIKNFYIGPNNKLYIVFAYGNTNFTSEMDIIEI